MSTHQIRGIEEYFPTKPWLEAYREAIEENESISETADGWGVGWNGVFIFQIEAVPLAENTIRDLPGEIVTTIDEAVRARDTNEIESLLETAPAEVTQAVDAREGDLHDRALAEILDTTLADAPDRIWDDLRAELPEIAQQLLAQIEENVADGNVVYAYLDIYDGGCREVDVVQSLDEREYGFRIIGKYPAWRKLVAGEGGVIEMLMSGELDVDGDMQKVLQYSDGAVDLADISADVDSRFLF